MKKLLFNCLFMTIVMSFVSLSSWAERVRPTCPAVALESGKTYYLYNVEADLFLAGGANNSAYARVNATALPVEIVLWDNGAYTLRFTSFTSYIYPYNSNIKIQGGSSSKSWFTFNSTDNGTYTIQHKDKTASYVGCVGSSDVVYADISADGNIHWKLIPADDSGDHFVAELKLYKELEKSDSCASYSWSMKRYEDLYADRANNSPETITNAVYELRNCYGMSSDYRAPYWNEYPIIWSTPDGSYGQTSSSTWTSSSHNTYFDRYLYSEKSSTISATVNVDQKATFIYSLSGGVGEYKVFVDGEEVRYLKYDQFNNYTWSSIETRFFEVLEPGTHTITWVANNTSSSNYYLHYYVKRAGVMKTPSITVSLLEPGSLGTEVLYNVSHIKDVRSLKVKGKMNDDDWAKIKMMATLQELDLSEAEFTEIPLRQFAVSSSDTTMQFLHRMKLPEGLKTVNYEAFYGSFVEDVNMPSTLKTIYPSAFYMSHIQELSFPDDCTNWKTSCYYNGTNYYGAALRGMFWLKKVKLPKNLETIPASTLYYDCYLTDVTLPDNLKKIGNNAFYHCNRADFGELPESLTTIGEKAFWNCNGIEELVIPKNVTSIGAEAFEYCYYLTKAELSVNQYAIANKLFAGCTRLESLRLNSPTLAIVSESSSNYPVDADKFANVDLIVPSYLVNNYKLDKYWYNFKSITGFSTSDIQDWTINRPLTLNNSRFEGTPDIKIKGDYSSTPYLKFNGTAAQTINNLTLCGSYNTSTYSGKESSVIRNNNYPGQIYSNGENVSVTGTVQVDLYAPSKTWEFFSLPFDCKISDITFGAENVQYAIRYYDGAARATYGAAGSWKNYDKANDVIPAGTGFILQTNKDTWCYFKAVDNAQKQNIVAYMEFSKTLDVNDCDVASNKGWNLIGNPYQCFYNDHSLNFTAPITVWSAYNKNYVAYSLTDDDYAIRPNEAFFVQCPNAEYNTVTFPLLGRQFTDVIESQNAVQSVAPTVNVRKPANVRKLVNLTLSKGENSDRTRIVLNNYASLGYEMSCDASKFMSMDNGVLQLYTLDADGIEYAINERPEADGKVQLGFYAPAEGTYTITAARCDADHVYLIDNENATTTEITNSAYSFSAEAGVNTSRFVIAFGNGGATGIDQIENDSENEDSPIYNLAGQKVEKAGKGIFITNGKKVIQ